MPAGIFETIATSLVLLGTLKNYGIAGGLDLTLFRRKTALPATVSSVLIIVYIKKRESAA
jgi:hypothetical protein